MWLLATLAPPHAVATPGHRGRPLVAPVVCARTHGCWGIPPAFALQNFLKLLLVSSHYNTQLGLLAALEVDKSPAAPAVAWLARIPALAAVLAFELHRAPASGAWAVRLVAQVGGPACAPPTRLQLVGDVGRCVGAG